MSTPYLAPTYFAPTYFAPLYSGGGEAVATFVDTAFTGTAGLLTDRAPVSGEVGNVFTSHPGADGNNLRINGTGGAFNAAGGYSKSIAIASGEPASAAVSVRATFRWNGANIDNYNGIIWRANAVALTWYILHVKANGVLELYRSVAGSQVGPLATSNAYAFAGAQDYTIGISHPDGDTITFTLDGEPLTGALATPYTDASPVLTSGRVGLLSIGAADETSSASITWRHLTATNPGVAPDVPARGSVFGSRIFGSRVFGG